MGCGSDLIDTQTGLFTRFMRKYFKTLLCANDAILTNNIIVPFGFRLVYSGDAAFFHLVVADASGFIHFILEL